MTITQNADCNYAVFSYSHWLLVSRNSPVVARYLSLANRHSCSTPAETQDRKCFSVQLILVVGIVDMINQICQMLSFCWKLLSANFAEKMITKYITKGALHTLNQMVNQTVNHLVKCVRVARSPDRRLKLT